MTYKTFKQLYSEAQEYKNFESFIMKRDWQDWINETGAFVTADKAFEVLKKIHHLANSENKWSALSDEFRSREEIAAMFGIPLRTVQNWDLGQRKANDYLIMLITYTVINDMCENKNDAAKGEPTMNEKTFIFNPNSKIFRSWQENSTITEAEFVAALGWLHDDPRDEQGRMTREIGLSPTGILRLSRAYTEQGLCYFCHGGKLWSGEHFFTPCKTEKERAFSADGENLITFQKITLSPDDLQRNASEFFPNPKRKS